MAIPERKWAAGLLLTALVLFSSSPALAGSTAVNAFARTLPNLVTAAPPGGDAKAPPAQDEVPEDASTFDKEIAAAKALFELGVARYEASDYGAAIDLWVQANSALPLRVEVRQMRAELNYNIATAQRKWFEVDQDVAHLRQAKITLERFASEIVEVYPPGDEADQETNHARELIEALAHDIEAVDARKSETDKELARLQGSKLDQAARRRESKRVRSLIVAGSVVTGLGAAGLGVMGAGIGLAAQAEQDIGALAGAEQIDERRALLSRGQTGNVLLVAGAVGGGALFVAGIATLAAGLAGRAKLRRQTSSASLTVAPAFGPGVGLLVLHGRF